MANCPGKDMRRLTAAFYRCPNCGAEVEIFSDEFRRRCPHCREVIEKESVPSCAEWCAAAKECLGEERYKEFLATRALREQQENPDPS